MATQPTSARSPPRSASLARISAVQQITGAPELIATSPVIMPTLSRPSTLTSSKIFSLTTALFGAV